MDHKSRYKIKLIKGVYQLFDNVTLKTVQINKKDAQILSALLKNVSSLKALSYLKKKHPRTHWKLKDITQCEDQFKKLFNNQPSKKNYVNSWVFKGYVIAFAFSLILLTLSYISNYSLFIDINRFFWTQSTFIILAVGIVSYGLIAFIHEYVQFIVARFLGIPSMIKLSFNISLYELFIIEDDLYGASRKNRLLFFFSGWSMELIILALLSLIVLLISKVTIYNEILFISFIRVVFQFILIFKSDLYYLFEDLVSIKGLNRKSLKLFGKTPDMKTSKMFIIRLHRVLIFLSIVLFVELMTLIIPVKLQIYTRAFNDGFYAFFGLNPFKFLLGVTSILMEIFIDIISIRLIFKNLSKD